MARSVFSSTTLLDEIMRKPMDPGYELVARRKAAAAGPAGSEVPAAHRHADREPGQRGTGHREGHRAPRPTDIVRAVRRNVTVVTVLGLLLGLVAGAGVAQLRTQPLQTADRAVLESEVQRRTDIADDLAASNAALRGEIEAEQAEALGDRAVSLLAAADRLALVTGAVPVSGEGVVVVMDDATPTAVDGEVDEDGRVRDADVQTVVNGLWSAGAEAVSINGQRLTTLSTIRHAGESIVVDLRQLARPYEIRAVGDRGRMLEEVRTGQAGRYTAFLRNSYGIAVSVEASQDVEVPAASRLTLRHARGVTAADQQPGPVDPVDPVEQGLAP